MIHKFIRPSNMLLASLAIVAAGASLSSCDNVDEDDRFIQVERPPVARKVLIQEFTGINCVNCPTGAQTVHEIQEFYPGSVIAVGMHPGGTGFSGPIGKFNLNSDLARVYYDKFQPVGFPAAMIGGEAPLPNINTWRGTVTEQIKKEAPGEIEMKSSYDAATRTVTVDYEVKINMVYSSPLNINIWLVENGIVGPQKSGSTIIVAYTHNHVLRTSLTGDWGLRLAKSFLPEETYTGQVSLRLDDEWKAENCNLVGFLQNDSYLVEQAEEIHVIEAQD